VKPYLSVSQHGFISGRSTSTNLVCYTQYISDALNSGETVDAIHFDFAKAFDKLDHGILM